MMFARLASITMIINQIYLMLSQAKHFPPFPALSLNHSTPPHTNIPSDQFKGSAKYHNLRSTKWILSSRSSCGRKTRIQRIIDRPGRSLILAKTTHPHPPALNFSNAITQANSNILSWNFQELFNYVPSHYFWTLTSTYLTWPYSTLSYLKQAWTRLWLALG